MKSPTPFILITLIYKKAKCFFAVVISVYTSSVFQRYISYKNATCAFLWNFRHANRLLVFRFFASKFAKLLQRADKSVTLSVQGECVGDLFMLARSGVFHLSCNLNGTFFMSSNICCVASNKYFAIIKVKKHSSFFLKQCTINSITIRGEIPPRNFLESIQQIFDIPSYR